MKRHLLYTIRLSTRKPTDFVIGLLREETDETLLFYPTKKMNGRIRVYDINVEINISSWIVDPLKSRAIGKIFNEGDFRSAQLMIWPSWKTIFLLVIFWWIGFEEAQAGSVSRSVVLFLLPFAFAYSKTHIDGRHLNKSLSRKLQDVHKKPTAT